MQQEPLHSTNPGSFYCLYVIMQFSISAVACCALVVIAIAIP